jgi:hypothetical protein
VDARASRAPVARSLPTGTCAARQGPTAGGIRIELPDGALPPPTAFRVGLSIATPAACRFSITTGIVSERISVGLNSTIFAPA